MNQQLTQDSIGEEFKKKVYTQQYPKKDLIDGTRVDEMKMMIGDEGYFAELLRINEDGKLSIYPDFKLAQINWVKMYPGTIKAWHLHYKQDEIWCVRPDGHLLVGLWDLRKDSPTKGKTMRLILGEGRTQFLYVPKGVAHGSSIVCGNSVELMYLVNQQFNADDPDELRLPWDSLGAEFWQPQRD